MEENISNLRRIELSYHSEYSEVSAKKIIRALFPDWETSFYSHCPTESSDPKTKTEDEHADGSKALELLMRQVDIYRGLPGLLVGHLELAAAGDVGRGV